MLPISVFCGYILLLKKAYKASWGVKELIYRLITAINSPSFKSFGTKYFDLIIDSP